MFCLFTCRFDLLLPFQSPQEVNKLSEEFTKFQLLCDDDIPKQIWEKATVKVDTVPEIAYHRMDIIWHYVSSLLTTLLAFQDSHAGAVNTAFQCPRRAYFLYGLKNHACMHGLAGLQLIGFTQGYIIKYFDYQTRK